MVQRNLDRGHKKEHAAAADRRNADSPIIVAVVVSSIAPFLVDTLFIVIAVRNIGTEGCWKNNFGSSMITYSEFLKYSPHCLEG